MTPATGTVHLPATAVRRLGWALVAAALLLPWGVLAVRARASAGGGAPAGDVRPEMLAVPFEPGKPFTMGSPEGEAGRDPEERQHEVVLTQAFAISRTEVTQGQYERVMGRNQFRGEHEGCVAGEEAPEGDALPVVCVTWHEAVEYCNRLSRLEGLRAAYEVRGEEVRWAKEANGYRLPTEAEWEYAARAGERTVYAGSEDVGAVAWFGEKSDGQRHPVGTKEANAWGLYDMSGNVWEWCWDGYDEYPTGAVTDPTGPEDSARRVDRGGSWGSGPAWTRVANRDWRAPSARFGSLGLRLARSNP